MGKVGGFIFFLVVVGILGNACDGDSSAADGYSTQNADYTYSSDGCDRDSLERSFHDMGFYVGMIENDGTELTQDEWDRTMDTLCAD